MKHKLKGLSDMFTNGQKYTITCWTLCAIFAFCVLALMGSLINNNRESYEREAKAKAEETSDKLAACKLIEADSAQEACVWVIVKK